MEIKKFEKSGEQFPLIEIQTHKKKLGWIDGYQYEFEFPKNPERQKGDAQLIFWTLNENETVIMTRKLTTALLERGLKPGDVVAHINEFYPNGRALDENKDEYIREGVGSQVLYMLIDESKNEGAKAFNCFTSKKSMYAFLSKHGFECLTPDQSRSRIYYKVL